MSSETALRESICRLACSMFERGLTDGASGNISARLADGGLLVTPTGSSFGTLDPARLSRFDAEMRHMDGGRPTKEMPLHSAFYETRQSAGRLCTSIRPIPSPFRCCRKPTPTMCCCRSPPYAIMHLGRVKLLPVYLRGDPAMDGARARRTERGGAACQPRARRGGP